MESSFLIVGLGNVGAKYQKTRHNVGFLVVDQIAKSQAKAFYSKRELKADFADFILEGKKVVLVKPSTYMNLSGEAVRKTIDYYKLDKSNLLIIVDDVDLPLGQLRLRSGGSSGGHNGLKSIEAQLSSKDYYRLKIGVGKDINIPLADYVLGNFTEDETEKLNVAIKKAVEVVEAFVAGGYQNALNKLSQLR